MFNQQKKSELKIGDVVTVGCQVDGKFYPVGYKAKIVVEKITEETPGTVRIDLDWDGVGKSKVYAHDEGKIWHKVENFN